LKYCEDDDPTNIAFALNTKDENHEDQHECRLAAHNDELRYDVREQDFTG
jgi:hypothetical protein